MVERQSINDRFLFFIEPCCSVGKSVGTCRRHSHRFLLSIYHITCRFHMNNPFTMVKAAGGDTQFYTVVLPTRAKYSCPSP